MSSSTTTAKARNGRGAARSTPSTATPPGVNATVRSVRTLPLEEEASGVADKTIKALCDMFKMLSDPSRLKILLALAENGEMHVSALKDLLEGQSQPAVSHHLSLMRFARLVDCKRDGKHNFYRLDSAHLAVLLEQFFGESGNGERKFQFEDFSLVYKKAR